MKTYKILYLFLLSFLLPFSQAFSQTAYVTSSSGNPWGAVDYNTCMDNTFGAGAWDDLDFETVNAATLFSPANTVIYLEGSDNNASALDAFLTANLPAIEAWVNAGGLLYLNAAPNVGGNINFGFGGVTLQFDNANTFTTCAEMAPNIAGNCLITDSPVDITGSFPICGNFFGHSFISGGGVIPILEDAATGNTILAELSWGAGIVVFGGIVSPTFQDPAGKTLLEGILTNNACAAPVVVNPNDIPTLSEWGLVALALLLMSYGTIAMAGVSKLAGVGGSVNLPITNFSLPFNLAVLRKAFFATAILAIIGYTCSLVLFGAIFFSDIVGVAIAGPIFAYLIHLLYLAETNK